MSESNPPQNGDDTKPEAKKSGLARFFGRSKSTDTATAETQSAPKAPATVEDGLSKSRSSLLGKIGDVFKGTFDLNDDLFEELEEVLITSDIGVEASLELVERLRERVKQDKIQDANGVVAGLRAEIATMLKPAQQEWNVLHQRPYVMLMVGVNGVGKTTTTAKIAKQFKDQGRSVMFAAADTFRAAATEQLQEWGRRLDIPVVAQGHGADAAAVAHDALTSAIVKGTHILMIDTAGRLHTQSDLMEQLQKINRVLANLDPSMPHEVMQILDAGTGQNALTQLDHFKEAVGVNSVCLTKLDGSAKGGLAISITQKYQLPIRYLGVGEGFDDLQAFDAEAFAAALVPDLNQA
ncbi:signal recognition particle-docking protein FtsY [Arenicella xantha]|uniref:Signal recognition particle receptor FtsY n=1 Tax=Arenicella xantha TaxID=644221 RepID=A0A395JP41_9GAMM|nr:signal recognition particle-docking protein FtsY [Arenicella xantha]RBP53420.1 fused signal recognition particle receptor [Arenicella xantha]